jgi:hypothetical protein
MFGLCGRWPVPGVVAGVASLDDRPQGDHVVLHEDAGVFVNSKRDIRKSVS